MLAVPHSSMDRVDIAFLNGWFQHDMIFMIFCFLYYITVHSLVCYDKFIMLFFHI